MSREALDQLLDAARGRTPTQRGRGGADVARQAEPEVVPSVPFADGGEFDDEGDGGEGSQSPATFKPPRSAPAPTFSAVLVGAVGERNWYRSLPFAAVPVLELGGGGGGGGGGNGLLTLAGILPPTEPDAGGEEEAEEEDSSSSSSEGPLVVVAFESREDAERLAFVWHCSGAASAAGAEVGSLRAMTPGKLDAAAESIGARAMVFRKGALRLAPGTPADALLAALAAGAAEQLLLSPSSPASNSAPSSGEVVDV